MEDSHARICALTNTVAAGMKAAPNPVLYDFVELYGPSTIPRSHDGGQVELSGRGGAAAR